MVKSKAVLAPDVRGLVSVGGLGEGRLIKNLANYRTLRSKPPSKEEGLAKPLFGVRLFWRGRSGGVRLLWRGKCVL